MIDSINFDEYNFRLVNFVSILKSIEVCLINDLDQYGLLKNNRITKDVKLLLLHHIIRGTCDAAMSTKGKEKVVIVYNITEIESLSFINQFDNIKLCSVIENIIAKIKSKLPIRVYNCYLKFNDLRKITKQKTGIGYEILSQIKYTIDKQYMESYSFSKIITFTKKNNLIFLNKEYFNTLKSKQLLLT
jgi:hypothetical protein